MSRFLWALSLVCVTAWPSAAQTPAGPQTPATVPSAAAPPDRPTIALGTEVFTDYTYTLEPKTTDSAGNVVSPNAFDVSRAYVDVTGRLSRLISFRVTPDINRQTDASLTTFGNLIVRLKHAFAEFDLPAGGTWIRAGLQPTPLVPYDDAIYRYRFEGSTFTERDGALVDADAGVSFHADLPGGYGDVHAGVFNGEGYLNLENGSGKAVQARATVRPFPRSRGLDGLRVTGFVDLDSYAVGDRRRRYVVNATFEHRRFNAGVEYLRQEDQPLPESRLAQHRGWSVWATPFLKTKGRGLEGLIRFDEYSLFSDVQEIRRRLIAGAAWWFDAGAPDRAAAIVVSVEQLHFVNFPDTPAAAPERQVAAHVLIRY